MSQKQDFGDHLLETVQTRENALVDLFGGYADIHVITGPQTGVEVTIRHTSKGGEKTETHRSLERKDLTSHYQKATMAMFKQAYLDMRVLLNKAKQRKEAA